MPVFYESHLCFEHFLSFKNQSNGNELMIYNWCFYVSITGFIGNYLRVEIR